MPSTKRIFFQANQNLEERLNEVRAELSDLKLLSERKREEKATTDKELEAIKKVMYCDAFNRQIIQLT